MFREIVQDLKYQVRVGGFWVSIILLCALVFIIINFSNSYFIITHREELGFENPILKYISLSSSWSFDLTHIWVWITHLFTHQGFFHILFNMLNLYWFGMIVEDLIGKKHAITIFFEAGLMGGIFFLLSCSLLPWYQNQQIIAYGASSSVMGLIIAAATISPNYNIRLIIIGNVALKYVAIVLLFIDLLFLGQMDNSGGHASHIGGAFLGYVYINLLRNGISLSPSDWFIKPFIASQKNSRYYVPEQKKSIPTYTEIEDPENKLNRILEKIKKSGINSLSNEEQKFLDQLAGK
ncbi:MAG: rhomboid family intramembrane serine protease [Saprospiraceae bacterium]